MLNNLLIHFAATCPKPTFFGLKPWYQYIKLNDKCDIQTFQLLPSTVNLANGNKVQVPSDVPLVLLAVVDDLLRLAGLIAVGYVIYGAIQYITSQGSPEGTAKAQSTIINALIGVSIATIAVVAVSFIGNKLAP